MNEEKRKNRIIPIIIGILAGIVVISLVILTILSLSSPKNRYFTLVSGTFSDISNTISSIENSPLGEILSLDISSKLNVNAKLIGDIKAENNAVKSWLQNLEKFEIEAQEDIDLVNQYDSLEAKILINNGEFLSGHILNEGEQIFIDIPKITDGYIIANNTNLEALWNKLGYDGPSSITTFSNWLERLNFSKKDINTFKKAMEKGMSKFTAVFDDEDFFEGIGEVKYDEGIIECNYIDFNMDSDKLNEVIILLLEEIRSKDEYIDIFHKIFSVINESLGYPASTREEFLVAFEGLLQEIRALEFSETDGIIARLYYKDKDILKVEILSNDYNNKLLQFTMVNGKDSAYYMYSNSLKTYEDKVTSMDGVITHVINVEYIDYETGKVLDGYGREITVTIDNSNEKVQAIRLIEEGRLFDYTQGETDITNVLPSVIRDYTIKCDVSGDNNLKITLIDNDSEILSTINADITITQNASFEYFGVTNGFNASLAADDEINTKKNEIEDNWKSFANNNLDKINQFQMAMTLYFPMFLLEENYNDFAE